jgi:hypothetical protein
LYVERLALFAEELFGVFEAGGSEVVEALGQDDGGGDDRAKESATADFIDAGYALEAVVTESLLGRVAADEELEHALLFGCSRDFFLRSFSTTAFG